MSKLLRLRDDKQKIVDMVFTIVQELCFDGIAHNAKVNIAQHFAKLRENGYQMDASCRMEGDPKTSVTKVTILLKNMDMPTRLS